jgi:hypothetical protein
MRRILALVLFATILSACGLAPVKASRWYLSGGEECIQAEVVDRAWDPSRPSTGFYLLVQKVDSSEVGYIPVTPYDYVANEVGTVVCLSP